MSYNVDVTNLRSKLRSRQFLFNQIKRLTSLRVRKLSFTGMVLPLVDSRCRYGAVAVLLC